jgi:hypothetical protein
MVFPFHHSHKYNIRPESSFLRSFIKQSTSDAFYACSPTLTINEGVSTKTTLATKEAYGTTSTVQAYGSHRLGDGFKDSCDKSQPCLRAKETLLVHPRTSCRVPSTCRLQLLQQILDIHCQDSKLLPTRMRNSVKASNPRIRFDGDQNQCHTVCFHVI